jgi:YD repeat-containing protein
MVYKAAIEVLSETTQLAEEPARTVGLYYAGGRLASTTYPGGTEASYQYNPVGATTAKVYENGLSALYRCDAAQRLSCSVPESDGEDWK